MRVPLDSQHPFTPQARLAVPTNQLCSNYLYHHLGISEREYLTPRTAFSTTCNNWYYPKALNGIHRESASNLLNNLLVNDVLAVKLPPIADEEHELLGAT